MNPRHSMQGRRFLFKEVGGKRSYLYGKWLVSLAFFVGMSAFVLNGPYPEPKTYITQEDYYRSLAKSYQRRLREPWMIEAGEHYDFLVASMKERLIEIQETGGRF